jgi:esterase/lipase
MKIYCFSGLGADERVFHGMDFTPHELVHVKWIEPKENEPLKSYALRMGEVINQNEPFALMGLSFGGMLVQELSKKMNPQKTIVISSISGKREKPFRMRITNFLKLYNYVPSKYFNQPSKIGFRLFGAKSEKEKQLLTDILSDSDPNYIRWAMDAISKWNNSEVVPAFRIHGKEDKLFPCSKVKHDYTVKGGGHLMVVSHSKEIEREILKVLPA